MTAFQTVHQILIVPQEDMAKVFAIIEDDGAELRTIEAANVGFDPLWPEDQYQ